MFLPPMTKFFRFIEVLRITTTNQQDLYYLMLFSCRVCRVKRMTSRVKSDHGSSGVRPNDYRKNFTVFLAVNFLLSHFYDLFYQ